MKKLFILIIWGMILGGCATMPSPTTKIDNIQSYQVSFDKVWGATIATFAEMALPIESIEKESGLITTKMIRTRRGPQIATIPTLWALGDTRFRVNLFANPTNETTRVQVNTQIEVYESGLLGTGGWRIVPSKGIIEQEILDSIRSRI